MKQTHKLTLNGWQRRALAAYKLVVTALLPFFLVLGPIAGIAGDLKYDVLAFNGAAVHGPAALLAGQLLMGIACIALAAVATAIYIIALALSVWLGTRKAPLVPRAVRASSTSTTIIRPENAVRSQYRIA